jgi:hypothetical protein
MYVCVQDKEEKKKGLHNSIAERLSDRRMNERKKKERKKRTDNRWGWQVCIEGLMHVKAMTSLIESLTNFSFSPASISVSESQEFFFRALTIYMT